jgi:hypothetical protein
MVEISPTDGIQVNYLALSYCWGTSHSAILKEECVVEWTTKGVAMEALSQTMQDAIIVTHSLGIPFIWIDALCIIQDSPDDLERELIKMGSVYANALLTIIVSDTVSSEGFLYPPKNSDYKAATPFHLPFIGPVGDLMTLVAEEARPYRSDRRINKRAWTLQERLLSRRLLIFENSPNRLYWNCGNLLVSHGGIQPQRFEGKADKLLPALFFDQGFSRTNSYSENVEDSGKPLEVDIQKKWRDICIDYSPRQIGKDSDRLHAIASLAAKFQKVFPPGNSYAAGLWLDPKNECREFFYSLTWEYLGQPRRPTEYIAPSWSWASQYDGVAWLRDQDPNSWGKCLCSVIRYLPKLRFESLPFGQLLEGSCLEVQGFLFSTTSRMDDDWGGHQFTDVKGIQHEVRLDSAQLDPGDQKELAMWRLPLFEGIGLLLEEVQKESKESVQYKRIGMYRRSGFETATRFLQDYTSSPGLDDWIEGTTRTRITLI